MKIFPEPLFDTWKYLPYRINRFIVVLKMFGLADCNSFYASCEAAFAPHLRGRAIIVLSNNDGCVVARNQQAKDLNIAMGVPFFQIRNLCIAKNVAVFSSNYTLYGDMSQRVFSTLGSIVPEIEIYSIDEAFLNLTGLKNLSTEFAESIVDRVYRWTGIPISVGIAPTRTLAKVANRIAKKRHIKSCLLIDSGEQKEALREFPLADIWGIGKKLLLQMERMGIRSALELSQQNPALIRKQFSVVQEALVRELNGEPCLGTQQSPPQSKSIQVSRSFGKARRNKDSLTAAISTFAARAAEKLRVEKSVARAIEIFIQTSPFQPVPQYNAAKIIPFDSPTDDTITIVQAAVKGTEEIFRDNFAYQKAGVMLIDITSDTIKSQMSLFESPEEKSRRDNLMTAMDRLNDKFGRSTVTLGAQLLDNSWKSSQKNVSPRYTTEWEDILVVK